MQNANVDIVAINLKNRSALGDDAEIYEIAVMLDFEGDETENVEECIAFIVKIADDHWIIFQSTEFITARGN